MKKILIVGLFLLQIGCSYKQENSNDAQAPAYAKYEKEDSILLAEVKAAPDVAPRQIPLFNDIPKLKQALGTVGIGEMRRWWNDGISWMSACNFYSIGSAGSNGLTGNLAFYLESPSEKYVESLKVKVNISNMAEKRMALDKYTSTVEKTFKAIKLTMPPGLKASLLAGKTYENDNKQRIIKNIFEPGNFDSWKLQIISR